MVASIWARIWHDHARFGPSSAAQAWRRRDSLLRLTPALDRLVHSRNVVAQGDPDLFVVDAAVGMRSDDSHALTSRQGISGVALMTSSGSLVAMSPSRPMTASPAKRSGRSVSQRFFPSPTSSAAASAASARSARRSSTPLVTDLRPQREYDRHGF